MRNRRTLLMIMVAALLLIAAPAVAAQTVDEYLEGKVRAGDSVTVAANETVDGDLYVFGGTLTIAGTVNGDLITFGGQIDIDGTVEGDVFAAGGTITIPGTVGGDIRAAGGQITVSGSAAEDAVLAGGQASVSGAVDGDFIFASGQTTVSGAIGGDVLGNAGTYTMTGTVAGTEDVTIGESSAAPTAQRNPFVQGALRWVSLALFGALLLWLAWPRTSRAIERLDTRAFESAAWGVGFLIALVLAPIVILIAGILLAILAGIVGLGAWVGLVIFTMLAALVALGLTAIVGLVFIAPVTVGTWLGQHAMPRAGRFAGMALGVAALAAAGLIPVVGPIVGFLAIILGTGAWLAGLRRVEAPTEAPLVPAM